MTQVKHKATRIAVQNIYGSRCQSLSIRRRNKVNQTNIEDPQRNNGLEKFNAVFSTFICYYSDDKQPSHARK